MKHPAASDDATVAAATSDHPATGEHGPDTSRCVKEASVSAPLEPEDVEGGYALLPEPPTSQSLYNWVEITQPFLEATKELSLGELLHDDLFGLFEAMSAIEMMDPKMDAGMQCNRQNRQPYTFHTAVEANHVKLTTISLAEQLSVMDSTLACLVTWLEGHSLAQTVFTNLYLHQPYEIVHPTIKAFSIATLKLVDIVKEFVSRANVYEEEDFQPLCYNFKLCHEVREQRVGGMLREAEEELQKTLRAAKSRADEDSASERLYTNALLARIRFYRLLFLGLVSLYKLDLKEGQRYLVAAKEQMEAVANTVDLGLKPEKDSDNFFGFERLVNQRLLPPTFPRYTEIRPRAEAVNYFKDLVNRLLAALQITQMTTFHSALDFFTLFSRSSPCILSRSVLQVLYQPLHVAPPGGIGGGVQTSTSGPGSLLAASAASASGAPLFQDLLREACRAFIAPPALITKATPFNAKQVKECIDNFFAQCCRPMGLLVQTFGHNRARQRDKVSQLLEEFSAVQEEADKLDTMLNAVSAQNETSGSRPHMLFFSTWLLYHILKLMVRYLLSGFELELYSVHEYPYLYWYLYELLYPWLSTCLHRADNYLVEHEQTLESQRKAGKNKKKVKSTSKKKVRSFYAREVALYQAHACMCAGFFKMLVGLKQERKIVIPSRTFDNESVRYEHRFAPFANLLTPPLMPYGQYLEIYVHTAQTPSPELFSAAAKDFGRSRQILENSGAASGDLGGLGDDELAGLIAVNKNNFVAASILARDATRSVEFDFAPHPTFPSIKFV